MGWRLGTEAEGDTVRVSHTRRDFLAISALAAIACVDRKSGDVLDSVAGRAASDDQVWPMYVGTYTKTGTSKGIYRTD
jgi:hypothetical protein